MYTENYETDGQRKRFSDWRKNPKIVKSWTDAMVPQRLAKSTIGKGGEKKEGGRSIQKKPVYDVPYLHYAVELQQNNVLRI